MLEDPCISQTAGRRRVFWTTQPQACGEYMACGVQCLIPGLVYVDQTEPYVSIAGRGRTIQNDNWLRSLVLNILNTRARTDVKCPSPAAVFGHWSESYRDDGLYVGATLWNAAAKPQVRVSDAVKAIGAAISADVGKLITMKLVDNVDVQTVYAGRSTVAVTIALFAANVKHVIDLSGTFTTGNWAWQ
jgi:hypothetical protein